MAGLVQILALPILTRDLGQYLRVLICNVRIRMLLPRAVERITCVKCRAHRICPGNGVSHLFLAFGQYADTLREATLVSRSYNWCERDDQEGSLLKKLDRRRPWGEKCITLGTGKAGKGTNREAWGSRQTAPTFQLCQQTTLDSVCLSEEAGEERDGFPSWVEKGRGRSGQG